MGMSTGGGGGFKNDINVTPLIDVVLVLLIISMATMSPKLHNEQVTVPPEVENKDNYITKTQVEIEVLESGSFSVKMGKAVRKIQRGQLGAEFGEKIISRGLVFFDCADLVTWDDCMTAIDVVQAIDKDVKVQWRIKNDVMANAASPTN